MIAIATYLQYQLMYVTLKINLSLSLKLCTASLGWHKGAVFSMKSNKLIKSS